MKQITSLRPKTASAKAIINRITDKKLVFRHSHIAITDYSLGDNREFEKDLSVFDEGKWRYVRMTGHYIERLHEFRIPRSYDPGRLYQHFGNYPGVVDNDSAVKADIVNIKLMSPPRDDMQRSAISFLCSQGYFSKLSGFTYRLLDVPTGGGKSYCCVAAACFMRAKSIVVVPKSVLLEQWRKSFVQFTDMTDSDVVDIVGSDACLKLISGNKKLKKAKVYLTMVDTLCSFADRYGDFALMDFAEKTGAYLTIIDEAHLEMKSVMRIHALVNTKMTVLATASPGRSQKKENWIYNCSYRNLPRFGGKFRTKEERFLEIRIVPYKWTPSAKAIGKMVTRRPGGQNWLNAKSYEREFFAAHPGCAGDFFDRLRVMMMWSKRIVSDDHKILVMCATKEGTHIIEEFLRKTCFRDGEVSHYYKTGMSKKEQREALGAHVIVATEDSTGTGFDMEKMSPDSKSVQHVYNISTYSTSIKAVQNPGRARKISDEIQVYYIEFVNFGYIKTVSQFEKRKPEMKKATKSGDIEIIK